MRALVGGGSKGIGLGCAVALAQAGATVTVMGRSADTLDEARSSLPQPLDQTHGAMTVDFSDWKAVRAAAKADVSDNGPVQILINNTGGPAPGPLAEAGAAALTNGFEMHILCNQALVHETKDGMIEAGYGRIINIISSSVVTPIPNLGVSNTIRGAVAQWGKTLAAELAPHGITVNNILPGSIDTSRLRTTMGRMAERSGKSIEQVERAALEAIPAGRLGNPSDIGTVVAFLASPDASYVTGVNLPVDGGRLAVQ
ncbi:MAG: SDR family oxidoreductase [Acidimicrobiia bacterium]